MATRHRFLVDGVERTVVVEALEGGFTVPSMTRTPIEVESQVPARARRVVATIEDGTPRAGLRRTARPPGYDVTVDGRRFEVAPLGLPARAAASWAAARTRRAKVTAPLAGVVVAVHVAVGEHVEAGAVLAVVEAMKMQNEVHAPRAGTITAIRVEAGARCERGDLLIEYDVDAG